MGVKIPVRRVVWPRCWRIIPTRYPRQGVFDRVTGPRDRPAVLRLEALTNQRHRESKSAIHFNLPPGSKSVRREPYVLAPFAYPNPGGSRFSDGRYGVYYTASTLETAVAETRFHRAKFLSYTKEVPMRLEMRTVIARLDGILHDIRTLRRKLKAVYDPVSYQESQKLGGSLWSGGSRGIAYQSVRHTRGQCVAAFTPEILHHAREERTLIYDWDGQTIARVYSLQEFIRS